MKIFVGENGQQMILYECSIVLCTSYKRLGSICDWTEKIWFLCNAFQLEPFWCYATHITTWDYVCNIHSNNEWYNMQFSFQYLVSFKDILLC